MLVTLIGNHAHSLCMLTCVYWLQVRFSQRSLPIRSLSSYVLVMGLRLIHYDVALSFSVAVGGARRRQRPGILRSKLRRVIISLGGTCDWFSANRIVSRKTCFHIARQFPENKDRRTRWNEKRIKAGIISSSIWLAIEEPPIMQKMRCA